MSLGYVGRVCVRAVQAAVRAEHQASKPSAPGAAAAAAHRQRLAGGLKDAPPAVKTAAAAEEQAMKLMKKARRAEKDGNVMHLLCWGPK